MAHKTCTADLFPASRGDTHRVHAFEYQSSLILVYLACVYMFRPLSLAYYYSARAFCCTMNIQSNGINCHSGNYLFSVLLAVHGHSDAESERALFGFGICSGWLFAESLSGTFTTRAAIGDEPSRADNASAWVLMAMVFTLCT